MLGEADVVWPDGCRAGHGKRARDAGGQERQGQALWFTFKGTGSRVSPVWPESRHLWALAWWQQQTS